MPDEMSENKNSKNVPLDWGKIGIVITTLAMIIFVCAFAYGYFQLSKINMRLARMIFNIERKVATLQNDVLMLQKSIKQSEQTAQKTQDISKQQEAIIAEWYKAEKGDLSKWQIAESYHLIKLANNQLQFSHNIPLALILLKQAEQVMQSLEGANELAIRQSIASNIAKLQAMPDIDITSLYLKLTTIKQQIDQLPLPKTPIKAEAESKVIDANLPWWKKGLAYSWNELSKIVIVRKNEGDSLPLVLPQEKNFLYQNLQAQIEQVMWALLHGNNAIYQASLSRVIAWINQYFDRDANLTKAVLQNLEELRRMNIEPTTINLADTLQLFSVLIKQPETTKTN